jgi:hypothetical protein
METITGDIRDPVARKSLRDAILGMVRSNPMSLCSLQTDAELDGYQFRFTEGDLRVGLEIGRRWKGRLSEFTQQN